MFAIIFDTKEAFDAVQERVNQSMLDNGAEDQTDWCLPSIHPVDGRYAMEVEYGKMDQYLLPEDGEIVELTEDWFLLLEEGVI